MDDGMMEELMITNTEHLGDINDFNKSSNVIYIVTNKVLNIF